MATTRRVRSSRVTHTAQVAIAEGLLDNLVTEPREFALPATRWHTSLSDLEWTGWGDDQARATGVWWRSERPIWVEVVADRLLPLARSISGDAATSIYTRIALTTTDGTDRTIRFHLPGSRRVAPAA